MTHPPSDDVAAAEYRVAQARRLVRYCRALGVDEQAVLEGTTEIDLSPICDEHGKIVPERVDRL